MKSYYIDELSEVDLNKIRRLFEKQALQSQIEDIWWFEIPADLLTLSQRQQEDLHPFVFTVELGDSWLKSEFLIRSLKTLSSECQAFCNPAQRQYILSFIDTFIEDLEIRA
jgi:hypothetical protein